MQSIGAKVYIDGAGEFKNDISTMIQATKTFKSELDAINKSDLNPFAKASLSKSALTKEIEAQEQKIDLLKEKLQETADKYGENSTQAMKVTEQIEKANAALSTMKEQLNNIKNPVQIIGDQIKGWGDGIQDAGKKLSGYGDWMSTRISAPIVRAFTASAKEAIDFESAMTGVQKTVDETNTTKYSDLADAIKDMSAETGLAKEELAGIMEIGGQLGITADNLAGFSRTIADLSVSTNLTAEAAATDLARFMNITGEAPEDINKLGSSLVALGNNYATSESEILEMSTRLASAGKIVGMSSTDIFALATAMSSVGINAEAGGTAMAQTLTKIDKAVDAGGEDLETYARIAGKSATDFAKLWKTEPVEAVSEFIVGLGKLDTESESVISVLDDLGLKGIRQSNMIKSLSLASDTLTSAIGLAGDAYKENTALMDEANKRYGTHENQIKALKERLGTLAIEIGERLLPYVDKFIDFADRLMEKWDGLDEGTQDLILKGALLVAAVGPILSVGGRLITGVGMLVSGFGTLVGGIGGLIGTIGGIGGAAATAVGSLGGIGAAIGVGGGGIIAALGSLAAAAAPFLIGGAIIAGIGFAVYEVVKHWDEIKEAAGNLSRWVGEKWDNIKESTSKAWDKVKTDVGNAWDNVKRDTKAAADEVGTKISTKWDEIKTKTSTTWENVKTAVGDAASNIKSSISDAAQNIWDKLSGTFSDLAGNAWSWGSDMINKLGEGVNNAWGWVESSVSGMGRFITDTLGGLVSDAWSWGSDLVSNIGNGISSGISWVKDKASGVAKAISDRLHFSVPDVGPLSDADEYMPDFMKLLAGGIYKNIGIVERASDVLAAAIMPNTDGMITGRATTTTINNGGTTINVYGAEGQDVHELADIVVRELTSTLNRQALTYG